MTWGLLGVLEEVIGFRRRWGLEGGLGEVGGFQCVAALHTDKLNS